MTATTTAPPSTTTVAPGGTVVREASAKVLTLRPDPFASLELIRSALSAGTPMGAVHLVLPRIEQTTARPVIDAAVRSLRAVGRRELGLDGPGPIDLTQERELDQWCGDRLAERVLNIDHDHVEDIWRTVLPALRRRGGNPGRWAGAIAVAAASNPFRVGPVVSLLYGTDRAGNVGGALSVCLSKATQQADNDIAGGTYFHPERLVEGVRAWVDTDLAELAHLTPQSNQRRDRPTLTGVDVAPATVEQSSDQWADPLIRMMLGLADAERSRNGRGPLLRLLSFDPEKGWSEVPREDRGHPAWWHGALQDAVTFGCCDEPRLIDYTERGIALHHLSAAAGDTLQSWKHHATTRRAVNEIDPSPNRWRRHGARRALKALKAAARLHPRNDAELLMLAVTSIRTNDLPRPR